MIERVETRIVGDGIKKIEPQPLTRISHKREVHRGSKSAKVVLEERLG
jgi:hypothetical protein